MWVPTEWDPLFDDEPSEESGSVTAIAFIPYRSRTKHYAVLCRRAYGDVSLYSKWPVDVSNMILPLNPDNSIVGGYKTITARNKAMRLICNEYRISPKLFKIKGFM